MVHGMTAVGTGIAAVHEVHLCIGVVVGACEAGDISVRKVCRVYASRTTRRSEEPHAVGVIGVAIGSGGALLFAATVDYHLVVG